MRHPRAATPPPGNDRQAGGTRGLLVRLVVRREGHRQSPGWTATSLPTARIRAGDDADINATSNSDPNKIYGNDAANLIDGEGGGDFLYGGFGVDTLVGNGGRDFFEWRSPGETGLTAATADVIADFGFGQGDRIDLSGIDADAYADGSQAFTFIGQGAFSGTPGEINYVHSGGNTYIQMQTGTSADVDGVIRLNGIYTPEASWFVL